MGKMGCMKMGCKGSKQSTAVTQPKADGTLLAGAGTPVVSEDVKPVFVAVGDEVVILATGTKGSILKTTATEILVGTTDGKEQWCFVGDVGKEQPVDAVPVPTEPEAAPAEEAPAVVATGTKGTILKRTATIFTKMGCKGKQSTAVVEPKADGTLLAGAGTPVPEDVKPESTTPAQANGDLAVGDEAVILATDTKGSVLKRTTTDVLVGTADGKEQWCNVEDVGKAPPVDAAPVPAADANQPKAEEATAEVAPAKAAPTETAVAEAAQVQPPPAETAPAVVEPVQVALAKQTPTEDVPAAEVPPSEPTTSKKSIASGFLAGMLLSRCCASTVDTQNEMEGVKDA